MEQKTLKILITGGSGYLGGRLAQSLSHNSNLLLSLPTHEMLPIDLAEGNSLEEACRGITAVIHLAALNEIESEADPKKALVINTLGTQKLLQAAIRAGVKRFIYLSTAHVYGAPLVGFISEKTIPRPVHPYAITHRAAEDWVLSVHDHRTIEGIVLRLSNSLGAPCNPEVNRWSLISNDLCRQAVIARKLTLRSSGLQKRDFISMSDVCRAISHCLHLSTDKIQDGLFNLGGECSLQVFDLAERIALRCKKTLGFSPPIERPQPAKEEVSLDLEYNIDKFKSTGFTLKGDLDSEIDATLRFCVASCK